MTTFKQGSPRVTPTTSPGVFRPIRATSVQNKIPPLLNIINCRSNLFHSVPNKFLYPERKLFIVLSFCSAVLFPVRKLAEISPCPACSSRRFIHRWAMKTFSVELQNTFESICPEKKIFEEALNRTTICTWIFCPDAAKGIMKPKSRSWVLWIKLNSPVQNSNLVGKTLDSFSSKWRQIYSPSWNLLNVACLQEDIASWRVFKENLESFPLHPKNTWACYCWFQSNVLKIVKAFLATLSKESSLILPEARRNLCSHKIFHKNLRYYSL